MSSSHHFHSLGILETLKNFRYPKVPYAQILIARAFINKAGLQEQLTVLPTPLFKTDWYVPVTHTFYAAHGQQVWRFWEQLVRQRQLLEASLRRQLEAEAVQAVPLP